MTKFFKLPSLTGRMSHNKLAIQILPTPPSVGKTIWEGELDKIRSLSQQSALNGRTYIVARQGLCAGDLVEWSPTGKRGLWRVTDISAYSDAADMGLSEMEQAVYDKKYGTNVNYGVNPCNEITLGQHDRLGHRSNDIARGKVRLEWFSGWRGYGGNARPVCVKRSEIRRLNEMETLGLAAS